MKRWRVVFESGAIRDVTISPENSIVEAINVACIAEGYSKEKVISAKQLNNKVKP